MNSSQNTRDSQGRIEEREDAIGAPAATIVLGRMMLSWLLIESMVLTIIINKVLELRKLG